MLDNDVIFRFASFSFGLFIVLLLYSFFVRVKILFASHSSESVAGLCSLK